MYNSKIDIRVEAARMAVALKDTTTENVLSVAKEIATFIQGDAELPEHYDSNQTLKEMMKTIWTTSLSPTPPKDAQEIVAEAGIHPAVKMKDED